MQAGCVLLLLLLHNKPSGKREALKVTLLSPGRKLGVVCFEFQWTVVPQALSDVEEEEEEAQSKYLGRKSGKTWKMQVGRAVGGNMREGGINGMIPVGLCHHRGLSPSVTVLESGFTGPRSTLLPQQAPEVVVLSGGWGDNVSQLCIWFQCNSVAGQATQILVAL